MREKLSDLYGKDGTKAVLSSLISILIGMAVGSVIILLVGLGNKSLGLSSAWEGIRLVFGGIFSTGRSAADPDGPFRLRGFQDRPFQHRRAGTVPHGHCRHPHHRPGHPLR